MPPGLLAVLALQVDNRWKTSSSEHVMLERLGPEAGAAVSWACKAEPSGQTERDYWRNELVCCLLHTVQHFCFGILVCGFLTTY